MAKLRKLCKNCITQYQTNWKQTQKSVKLPITVSQSLKTSSLLKSMSKLQNTIVKFVQNYMTTGKIISKAHQTIQHDVIIDEN